jgi:superfamily II DNA/RNA helicase
MTFKDIGLTEKVLAAVETAGYSEPTPIQAQAIPQALAGRDILGIAQTGTGKTAAFVLPMLCRLETGRARARMPRTLILEPTRELAAQVEESFVKYGANHKLNVALLIGGVSFADQETKIMRGADVLIATPGRLLDFHERGKLLLTGIDILVIDEADRMLDMGFIPDIERICKLVPFTRQTLFFSATMPPEITRLTEQFLQNPVRIEVARVGTTAALIKQILVATHGGSAKRDKLRELLNGAENFKNAIIFSNRKRDVAILHKSLLKHGFSAGALHGDMDQPARMASLDAFKRGDVSLLVCSDVAARGLDIPDVSHVFNFDIPMHPDDYVHRIGRTGRAGKTGTAISLITHSDERYIDDIQKLIKTEIEWMGPKLNELGEAPIDRDREHRRGERTKGRGRDRDRSRESRHDRFAAMEPAKAFEPGAEPAEADAAAPAMEAPARQPRGEGRRGGRPDRNGTPREHGRTARPPRDRAPQERSAQDRPVQERSAQDRPARPIQDKRPPRHDSRPLQAAGQAPEERKPRRYDDDLGPSFVGLGDHVPSFLLRPVRKPAPAEKQAAAEE